MKSFLATLALLVLCAAPLSAASTKKITVSQLKEMLASLQQAKKSDTEVATALKQVELTEELTTATMNSLASLVPGQASNEQIFVLEARSAALAPPADDLPTAPAPDAAAQSALLAKAADYAAKTYAQLPALAATKTTLRFQDNVEAVQTSSGMHSSANTEDPNLLPANLYIRYLGAAQSAVQIVGGVEQAPGAKDKTVWGANGQIYPAPPGPVLGSIVAEAQAAGRLNWLRWQAVNGVQTAVFSFAVEKKKSHYAVNYCCYPETDQSGKAKFSSAALPTGGGGKGNLQTTTDWKPFKTTIGYHGELFINPETGIIVRLVSSADFKPSDVVHQEVIRIDYAPVTVTGKSLILPVKSYTGTEDVPKGDDYAGKVTLRHTLLTSEYKDYQPASAQ